MKANSNYQITIIVLCVILAAWFVYGELTVSYTVPQDVRLDSVREFVINVDGLTIDVHLENGGRGTVERAEFLSFWNNTMTASQRTVIKQFVKQLTAMAMDVSTDDVGGELGD